jgi:hypothetical protein
MSIPWSLALSARGRRAPSSLSSPPQPLASIPVPAGDEELWYCILKGKFVGVTQNHPLAVDAVLGVSNNSMRSYKTQVLALAAFNNALAGTIVEVRPY